MVYIAMLRGINVGGNGKIKMTDLKSKLETLGLMKVQTYIQSGNVLFESKEGENQLRLKIETEIQQVFGVTTTVVLRTTGELESIIRNFPYDADALKEGESIQLTALTEPPTEQQLERLSAGKSENDEFQVVGRDIYLLLRQRMMDSKLAANLQKLGKTATTRNWNTINKLAVLARGYSIE